MSEPDYDATVAEYHASRARYIRTILAGVEQRLMETVGKRRGPLVDEITNLSLLAQSRYDVYQVAQRAHTAKPPGHSLDKLYKAAMKAGAELSECNALIKKRKNQLEVLDQKMRVQVEQYGRDIIAQLETPSGLENAFMRDPLLGRAHARMLAAQARRERIADPGGERWKIFPCP